jgi:hypothetical protein
MVMRNTFSSDVPENTGAGSLPARQRLGQRLPHGSAKRYGVSEPDALEPDALFGGLE